jgi:hypothetical protein
MLRGQPRVMSLDTCLLRFQDFFKPIVQHEMVAAGEGLDEASDVLMSR